MKLKNAPGRKNTRRQKALTQLYKATNTKADRLDRPPGFSRKDAINNLAASIVSDGMARGIRTKKDRSARGKLR
jgi:hypothetical protein